MTLLPSNCKVFETVKQDQSMQMQTSLPCLNVLNVRFIDGPRHLEHFVSL